MEISSLLSLDTTASANEGAVLFVKHPTTSEPLTNQEKAITIRLMGMDSDMFERVKDAIVDKRIKSEGRILPTQSENRLATIEQYAALTLGWENMFDLDGKEIPFTKDAARKLYTKLKWLREQVGEFVNTRENFLRPLSTT